MYVHYFWLWDWKIKKLKLHGLRPRTPKWVMDNNAQKGMCSCCSLIGPVLFCAAPYHLSCSTTLN